MKYVIGDIHGECIKIRNLVDFILEEDQKPEFIFIGDYLDKGEDVYATLKYLNKLQNRFSCTFLMGNHEYLWMQYTPENKKIKDYLSKYGGEKTLESFGLYSFSEAQALMLNEFPSIFNKLQAYWADDEYFICHSGVRPVDWQITPENIEIENFLFNRYEFIKTNTLYFSKKIIFGHTGFYSPFYDGCKIGIDTSCCFYESQPLTAYCIDSQVFMNSDAEKSELTSLSPYSSPCIPRDIPWRMK
jgi:serine/threonine protein phosphatase 1